MSPNCSFFFQLEFLQHAGFRGSRGRRQRRLAWDLADLWTVLGGVWCVGDADGGLAELWKEDGQNLWPVSGGEDEA